MITDYVKDLYTGGLSRGERCGTSGIVSYDDQLPAFFRKFGDHHFLLLESAENLEDENHTTVRLEGCRLLFPSKDTLTRRREYSQRLGRRLGCGLILIANQSKGL